MKSIFSKTGVSVERLQVLENVVKKGSIHVAANNDPTKQSLISRQIGELEKGLGLTLLDRKKKPHTPTPDAKRLADSCGRFLREVEGISAEASGLQRPITVGAGEVVIREFLIPKIGKRKKGQKLVPWVMRNLTSRKIQEGLEAEWLDVGIASGIEASGSVDVKELETYGYKLLLPDGEKPDQSGWKRLEVLPVVILEGGSRFRRFLEDCEKEHGVRLTYAAECTSYPQTVDFANATGSAVFVPGYWWKGQKEWKKRTHELPGLEEYKRTLLLGWKRRVTDQRTEVAKLVRALGGKC